MLNLQQRIKGFAIDLEESETLGTTFLNLNRSSEFASDFAFYRVRQRAVFRDQ